jgi:hypothetical protein
MLFDRRVLHKCFPGYELVLPGRSAAPPKQRSAHRRVLEKGKVCSKIARIAKTPIPNRRTGSCYPLGIGGFYRFCAARRSGIKLFLESIGQSFSSLGASSLQDFSAVCRTHSLTEAVLFLSLTLFGLVGSQHLSCTSSVVL